MIDYIDEDVAYLLGMIYARGRFSEEARLKTLEIEIEFKSLEAEGLKTIFNQKDQIILSINRIRDRINELLDVDIRTKTSENSILMYAHFTKNSMAWRNLRLLTGGQHSFHEFKLPSYFFQNSRDIKSEFIRGFCDLAGYIRKSNADQAGVHRIYIQISNTNWVLPVQICKILQTDFNIPVQSILWGHPNLREPNRVDVPSTYSGWAREHQIRVYAQNFVIGFGFDYKQKILREFADFNRKIRKRKIALCYPGKKSGSGRKPKHPCQESELLPVQLRGRHFNGFREICKAMGCTQSKRRLSKGN
jgi:hypothetical protein